MVWLLVMVSRRWYYAVVIALTMAVDVTGGVVGADDASSGVVVVMGSQ